MYIYIYIVYIYIYIYIYVNTRPPRRRRSQPASTTASRPPDPIDRIVLYCAVLDVDIILIYCCYCLLENRG